MTRLKPKWIMNKYGGLKPVCPYCLEPYVDGDIFDVKNYPADGGATMFLICQDCKNNKTEEEAELHFDWKSIRPKKNNKNYITKKL